MTKLEKFTSWANIVATLVAATALIWNVFVFRSTSKENENILNISINRQNITVAYELYQDYLNLAFKYPNFAFDEVDFTELSEKKGKEYLVFAEFAYTTAWRIHSLQNKNNVMNEIVYSIVRNHIYYINECCDVSDKSFLQYLKEKFPGIQCP